MKTRFAIALVTIAGCSSGGPTSVPSPLVQGLHLSQIASYQTLRATLMKDGTANDTPEVPLIAGRDLMLRAFVAPDAGWDGHEIIVRFEMTSGGTPLDTVEVKKIFTAASTESDLDSTANVNLTADQVTTDLTYLVSLHEEKAGPDVKNDGAIWPAPDSQASAGVQDTGSGEHIVIIPIEYDADGSGRLPDTGDAMISTLKARMLQLYPVSKVEITIGKTMKWPNVVQATGKGWGQLLNAVINQRIADGVANNVYYYGMMAPSASFESFCGQGCVLGLSPASTDPNDIYQRGSLGVGYLDSYAESDVTFVHEVGHAHGRQHAPCGGAAQPDPKFPYSNGGIGDWGWDGSKLLDPASMDRDMMGYCSPVWISDFNYSALFTRITYLNSMRGARSLQVANRWRSIVVEDGTAVRSSLVTVAGGGEARNVERVSSAGSDTVPARFYPFDHLPGGILLVPEDADVGTLKFNGITIR